MQTVLMFWWTERWGDIRMVRQARPIVIRVVLLHSLVIVVGSRDTARTGRGVVRCTIIKSKGSMDRFVTSRSNRMYNKSV